VSAPTADIGWARAWGLTDGRRQAVELGYVPLPPPVVSQVEAYWRASFTGALRLQADGSTPTKTPK
jgi:hypothetical protein